MTEKEQIQKLKILCLNKENQLNKQLIDEYDNINQILLSDWCSSFYEIRETLEKLFPTTELLFDVPGLVDMCRKKQTTGVCVFKNCPFKEIKLYCEKVTSQDWKDYLNLNQIKC